MKTADALKKRTEFSCYDGWWSIQSANLQNLKSSLINKKRPFSTFSLNFVKIIEFCEISCEILITKESFEWKSSIQFDINRMNIDLYIYFGPLLLSLLSFFFLSLRPFFPRVIIFVRMHLELIRWNAYQHFQFTYPRLYLHHIDEIIACWAQWDCCRTFYTDAITLCALNTVAKCHW